MRAFLGFIASIPFFFIVPGMIIVLAFSRTYFDPHAFSEKIIPHSYNSATLLVAQHFSGDDRELTSIIVERLRHLVPPEEYVHGMSIFFEEGKRALENAQETQVLKINLDPVKKKLMSLVDPATERITPCSQREIQKNITMFCLPSGISREENNEKIKQTLSLLIEKEIPSEKTYYSKDMNAFTIGAYQVHRSITMSLVVILLVYAIIQALIQYSIHRVLYFLGGLMIAISLMLRMIIANVSRFPIIAGMSKQFNYAQEHFIRFLLNEPLPLLKSMSLVCVMIGVVLIGCGVLYNRERSLRSEEKTL